MQDYRLCFPVPIRSNPITARLNRQAAGPSLRITAALGALVTLGLLTTRIGDWPRLQVGGALDAALTVLLLTAASAATLLLAARILRRARR